MRLNNLGRSTYLTIYFYGCPTATDSVATEPASI
jgi:hypothetical protein